MLLDLPFLANNPIYAIIFTFEYKLISSVFLQYSTETFFAIAFNNISLNTIPFNQTNTRFFLKISWILSSQLWMSQFYI